MAVRTTHTLASLLTITITTKEGRECHPGPTVGGILSVATAEVTGPSQCATFAGRKDTSHILATLIKRRKRGTYNVVIACGLAT